MCCAELGEPLRSVPRNQVRTTTSNLSFFSVVQTRTGCDRVPNSPLRFDACGVCGGNNGTCSGCDRIPNTGRDRFCSGHGRCGEGECSCTINWFDDSCATYCRYPDHDVIAYASGVVRRLTRRLTTQHGAVLLRPWKLPPPGWASMQVRRRIQLERNHGSDHGHLLLDWNAVAVAWRSDLNPVELQVVGVAAGRGSSNFVRVRGRLVVGEPRQEAAQDLSQAQAPGARRMSTTMSQRSFLVWWHPAWLYCLPMISVKFKELPRFFQC
eukprot:1102614-Rhodomonas_salina.1